ncbi:hypothetical protein ACFOJ6_19745 [Gordonia humi]|uniref:hypothetical protein n=1 Tax=Gordonia humi TaxID=686429 RepID=UPI0036183247
MNSRAAMPMPGVPTSATTPATGAAMARMPAASAIHSSTKEPATTPTAVATPMAVAATASAPIGSTAAITRRRRPTSAEAAPRAAPAMNTGMTIEPNPAPRGSPSVGGATSTTAAFAPACADIPAPIWVSVVATAGLAPVAITVCGSGPTTKPP